MTVKLINTVLKAAAVAAVPLAILTVSAPAGAQRPPLRHHSEWRFDNARNGYARFDRWDHKKPHKKKVHHKNRNYKNGYYRNGRGSDGRYRQGNGYPANGAHRGTSTQVIPGFPNPIPPGTRQGKALPGTNPQYNQIGNRDRRY